MKLCCVVIAALLIVSGLASAQVPAAHVPAAEVPAAKVPAAKVPTTQERTAQAPILQAPTVSRPDDTGDIKARAANPRPATAPRDVQRVAVLSIRLDIVKGEVRSAIVQSARRLASVAPKVFARRGGTWEVVIEGDTPRSFFVDHPGRREAEAHPGSGNRYESVDLTGMVEWPLVVPLYANGRSLGARSITIRDTGTGATVLRAEI